ncbi:TonB-dependent siderophore receptor [Steroidobacter sp.]|uniref:TonB-dependent siderophore receptor n=1 Tax=Steroidobacter sp. TaxID=1978227 RepID=UPI001A5608B6|nr:TonB-dependent siderophore receptor [Steroidobacter sp.]MBL8267879.1 TonB-dependent siderophore receptor [Steroidobacter sp.]
MSTRDIPAGSLGTALATFAINLRVPLSFDPALTIGKRTAGLRGDYTIEAGFRTLLAGSGLEAVPNGEGGYLLRRQKQSDDSPSVTLLPKVRVESDPNRPATTRSINSATRTETLPRDVPQSTAVVTSRHIEELSLQSLSDAAQYVPGIGVAQGEGNRETLIFRGSNTSTDFFVDGLRDDAQYYRDLYNVERVEVLQGPNAMMFGRGGSGGILNRVTKVAGFDTRRQLAAQVGTNRNRRATLDIGQPVADSVALRLNAMYEDSGSYRDQVTLRRYGINPSMSIRAGPGTTVSGTVEYFNDERTADRGVSAFNGRPLPTDPSQFFGDPKQSWSRATVRSAGLLIEHELSEALVIRSQARFADYDKYFQNVFPGAVRDGGATVQLAAHNLESQRRNLFDKTDLTFAFATGELQHQLLAGVEVGRQEIDNRRGTGYFDSLAPGTTSVSVSVLEPRTTLPVSFRQSSTDADNSSVGQATAGYLQLQTNLTRQFLATLGLRYERFDVAFNNRRTGERLRSADTPLSPRIGVTFKPVESLSLYVNYGTAFQSRAGEQFMSLSASTQSLDPEEFHSSEVGAKWHIREELSFTAAAYRLKRDHVAIADPNEGSQWLLVDGQRVQGVELSLTGAVADAWDIVAAYAFQRGEILSDQSASIRRGARLAALPRHSFSLWNRYDLSPAWSVGLGVVTRSDTLAATENLVNPESNVTLPGYARFDAAVFWRYSDGQRVQMSVENLLDKEYFLFAHSNTNITPGSPRALRVAVVYEF